MSLREATLGELQSRLGYRFRRVELLDRALRHSSAAHEQQMPSNERLEFLGDAALSHAAAALLFERWEDASEGELTRARAALVRERTLAAIGRELDLAEALELGGGAAASSAILADGVEAVLGALLLDGGWSSFKRVVRRLLAPPLAALRRDELSLEEPKSTLQEIAQKQGLALPVYHELEVRGPAHGRIYVVEVEFDGEALARGEGRSKRSAQQAAARAALQRLGHGD